MSDNSPVIKAVLRRAWLLPTTVFLLVAIGTLGPGSYFLHFDTATQDVIATDLLNACLGTRGGKPGVSLILWAAFAVGGSNPLWEMVILSVLGAASVAAIFRLIAQQTGSNRWALLGSLWFLSLPTILYYTRMHIGYPLAFFTLGLVLQRERHFGRAGLAFGLTLISHANFVIPVAVWLGWSALLDRTPLRERIRLFARMAAGILIPILLAEAIYFLFLGQVFGWSGGIVRDGLRLARAASRSAPWRLTHVIEIVAFSNGWLNAALLVAGLVYPAVRKPRVALMDAFFLAGWSVVALYGLRVASGNTFLTPRMFAGIYPLLLVTSVFSIYRLVVGATRRLSIRQRLAVQRLGGSVVALILPFTIIHNTLNVAVASGTAYDEVDRWVGMAADAGLPVRYSGIVHVGEYFGLRHGVEMSVNETDPGIITGDTQAVLIFEGRQGESNPVLERLLQGEYLDRSQYEVTVYPHVTLSRPRRVESYGVGPAVLRELSALGYGRETGAVRSEMEVWWPRNPAGTFAAREVAELATGTYIVHYQGGCITPKEFDGDTKNYYDIFFEAARPVLRAVGSGDLQEARRLVGTALEDGRIGQWEFRSDGN